MQNEKLIQLIETYRQELGLITVNPLGSCQYQGAWATHQFTQKLLHEVGILNFCSRLGIKYKSRLPIPELEHKLYECLVDNTDPDEDDIPLQNFPNERVPISEYFKLTRNLSWDLWSAMPDPPEYLVGFTMDPIIPEYLQNFKPDGDNFRVGLSITLFLYFYPNEITIQDLADFDT